MMNLPSVRIALAVFGTGVCSAFAAQTPLSAIPTSPGELARRVPGAGWSAPLDAGARTAPCALPTLAIEVKADDLFSDARGLYVPGDAYAKNGYGSNKWGKPNANYFGDGEVPATVKLFEPGATAPAWAQSVTLAMHGGATRALPQKSLELLLDKSAAYTGSFFPGEGTKTYRAFLLRNGGNDWYGPATGGVATMLKDAFFHRLAAPLKVGTMAYRPCVVTINGEYWGLHNLRELPDKHYFKTRYDVPAKTVDAVTVEERGRDGTRVRYVRELGSKRGADDYRAMLGRLAAAKPEVLLAAAEREIDLESFTDYMIAEMFFANTDWPWNNVLCWHTDGRVGGVEGDGRWRWVLYDLDLAGVPVHGIGGAETDMFAYLSRGDTDDLAHPAWLFHRLWSLPAYRERFAARAQTLLIGAFSPARTAELLKDSMNAIAPEIERHYRRWGRAFTESDWRKAVDASISQFLATRRELFPKHLAAARAQADRAAKGGR